MKASDNPYPSVFLDEQAADPSTPAADRWRLYAKAGGIYAINSAAAVAGPFGAAGAGGILAYDVHVAGDETISSATIGDIDATNSVVTFTAPASGNVLVVVTGVCAPPQTTGAFISIGLRESTTNIAGAAGESIANRAATNATVEWHNFAMHFIITGLTPSASLTYKSSAACSTGSGTIKANASSPLIMVVYAL